VGFLSRHRRIILLMAFLGCLPMGWSTARLFSQLRASFEELLPDGARSVRGLRAIREKVGEQSQLTLILRGPGPEALPALKKFADDLAPEIKKELGPMVRAVDYKIVEEREFFKRRGWLYVEKADLDQLLSELKARVKYEKKKNNPLFIDLDPEPAPKVDFERITKKHSASNAFDFDSFKDGYFASKDGTLLGMIIRRQKGIVGKQQETLDAAKRVIARLDPRKYHPKLEVGYAGDVAGTVEETASLMEDIIISTVLVFLLCGVVVVTYFRRLKAVYLLGFPLLVGALATFTVGFIAVGYLNSNTAFLASIIIGNGVNFGIILLARYSELREKLGEKHPSSDAINEVIGRSLVDTAAATLTAASAASIAYGSLVITDFKGFNQFGFLGGTGMILCWIASFTVMPLLIMREEDTARQKGRLARTYGKGPSRHLLAGTVARVVNGAPSLFAAGTVVLILASAYIAVQYLKDPIEWDFSRLRSKVSETKGAGYWDTQSGKIFTRYLSPTVILAKDKPAAEAMATELRKAIVAQGDRAIISNVDVASAVVPPEDLQRERLVVIKEIRHQLVDEIRKYLTTKEKADLDEVIPPAELDVLKFEDLPLSVRDRVVQPKGEFTSAVLIFPRKGVNMWDARVAFRFEDPIRVAEATRGESWLVGSTAILFNDMIRAVNRDGPRATAISLLGVVLLCLLSFRGEGGKTGRGLMHGMIVAVTLVSGVVLMVASLAVSGVRINFLNFIAFPITFGIGVDYGVNVYRRYLVEGPGRMVEVVTSAGGAVALCSLTTVIGYSALLIADNRGLVSFGLAANVGEFTCLAVAVLGLPAVLRLLEKRRAVS
jgi:predicted RND superfamily exporter protein